MKFHPTRLYLGEIEKIVDQSKQVTRTEQNVIQKAGLALGQFAVFAAGQEFGEPDNAVQRRSQLMTHVGQKFTLQTVCLLRDAGLLD